MRTSKIRSNCSAIVLKTYTDDVSISFVNMHYITGSISRIQTNAN